MYDEDDDNEDYYLSCLSEHTSMCKTKKQSD